MTLRWAMVCVASPIALGCVQVVPPPASPAPVAPAVGEVPPPEEGLGRLVVDVVDGPTEVMRLERQTVVVGLDKDATLVASSTATVPLCSSPCVADLPFGRHVLAFPTRITPSRLELDEVEIGPTPQVYRRALGSYERAGAGLPLGIVGVTLGGMAVVTGVSLLPIGLSKDDGEGMALAGGVTLAVGAILTAAGILGIALDPATLQPGASTLFTTE